LGTRLTLTLPITLAIIQALVIRAAGRTFAVPLNSVLESLRITHADVRTIERREVMSLRGQTLPLARLERVFRLERGTRSEDGRSTRSEDGRIRADDNHVSRSDDNRIPPAEGGRISRSRDGEGVPRKQFVVVVGLAQHRIGLLVDELLGQEDIVIKSLGRALAGVPGIAGATELGGKKTVLVLDVAQIVEEAVQQVDAA
jgi:two-component system chemotaxis sensor kinase CheA